MGFVANYADADLYMRRATGRNGAYWKYILVYVDDLLILSLDTDSIIKTLKEEYHYTLKDVGPPTRYLGATMSRFKSDDCGQTWAQSAEGYITKALPLVKQRYPDAFKKSKSKQPPITVTYHPELDTSAFLSDEDVAIYHSYIGILRWAVELGRIDIAYAVSRMSSYSACSRQGHLEAVIDIFVYLSFHSRSRLVYNYRIKDHSKRTWVENDWSQFYPDAKESIPTNAPEALGNSVRIDMYVDASHGSNLVNRRSQTGIIILVNSTPILWMSKAQSTVETSTFGSEFVALRIGTERDGGKPTVQVENVWHPH
jgi:hypothetical protein